VGARTTVSDPGRPLYLIGVVAEMLKIHPQTLRLYERKGLIRPSRTVGRTRMYSDEDVDEIRRILRLTRDLGVNLAGLEIILKMRRQMLAMQEGWRSWRGTCGSSRAPVPGEAPRRRRSSVADRRIRKLDVFDGCVLALNAESARGGTMARSRAVKRPAPGARDRGRRRRRPR
jgi:MerR family transcriptional regulator/heat shock protein HspR